MCARVFNTTSVSLSQDETPLFLAAREGSFEAAKSLLDHFANPEITDQMDRLPKDVAQERLHHDIVQLLEEYAARSPAMQTLLNGQIAASPALMSNSNYAVVNTGKPTKQKKRVPRQHSGRHTPVRDTGSGPTSRPLSPNSGTKKSKKRKDSQSTTLSPGSMSAGTLSPPTHYESSSHYGSPGHYGSPVGQVTLSPSTLSPPPQSNYNHYSTIQALQSAPQPNVHMNRKDYDDIRSLMHQQQQQQQQMSQNHPVLHRANSLMHSSPMMDMGMVQQQASLPQHQPITTQWLETSLPQSTTSPVTSQSPIVMSPTRKNYPTSPMHIAAMQQHAKQNQQHQQQHVPSPMNYSANSPNYADMNSLPYTAVTNPPQDAQQHYSNYAHMAPLGVDKYPTPPSQHSQMGGEYTPHHLLPLEQYPTPSPESPGQWSSSSPHSAHSDWSEGISSPPTSLPQGSLPIRGDNGVYI